jgi:hypothetical protein
MVSEELKKSWQRTEAYLRDARAHFSNAAEGTCFNELHDFQDYLDHNELGLALECLDDAFERSGVEDLLVLENMALAAASMGLQDRQRVYDERLSVARGRKYETVLPS